MRIITKNYRSLLFSELALFKSLPLKPKDVCPLQNINKALQYRVCYMQKKRYTDLSYCENIRLSFQFLHNKLFFSVQKLKTQIKAH